MNAPTLHRPGFAQPRTALARWLARLALIVVGAFLVLAGIVSAPLPGPSGPPISMVSLAIVLRNSYWAKRQVILTPHARPKIFYRFRRLLRRQSEFAPDLWRQALQIETLLLKRAHRVLARGRKNTRRYLRKLVR